MNINEERERAERAEACNVQLGQRMDALAYRHDALDHRIAELTGHLAESLVRAAKAEAQVAAVRQLCDAYDRNSGGYPIPSGPPLTTSAVLGAIDDDNLTGA